MALVEVSLSNEAELESILVQDPDQIEIGFTVLSHQKKTDGTDALDILGVSQEGILSIIELKVRTDKNQLRQAFKYYDYIMKQGLDWFREAYKDKIGDRSIIDVMPQIMLISPDFDEEMLIEAKYLRDDITVRLFKYKAVLANSKKEIVLFEQDIPTVKIIEEKPWVFSDNERYIKDEEVRAKFNDLVSKIKSIDSEIEEKPDRRVVRYFISGRKICDIYVKQKYINVGYKTADDENGWDYAKEIKTEDQFIEILNLIKTAYELMKTQKKKRKNA